MGSSSLNLREFKIPLGKLAPLESFRTRQGDSLSYRFYSAWSEDLVVLYHGAGGDSRYMCALAAALSGQGIANVVTPDFRCHGGSSGYSDLISPSQLEIDLEELLIHLKMKRSISRVTLAGHSMGGGFTLRVATSDLRWQFSKFIALAPHLPEKYHSQRPDYGGWITPDAQGFRVNFPEGLRTGNEKLHYSFDFLKAVHANEDVLEKIATLKPAVRVITGRHDEVVDAEIQAKIFSQFSIPMMILENANHLTVVSKVESYLSMF